MHVGSWCHPQLNVPNNKLVVSAMQAGAFTVLANLWPHINARRYLECLAMYMGHHHHLSNALAEKQPLILCLPLGKAFFMQSSPQSTLASSDLWVPGFVQIAAQVMSRTGWERSGEYQPSYSCAILQCARYNKQEP